jgi:hypothetical protein
MNATADKVRENRLRRMAARQGLALQKSRTRDPRALAFGAYWLVEAGSAELVYPDPIGTDLDGIEEFLTGKAGAK